MEENDAESWSSAHIHHSQWLQRTISDLDDKLDNMMAILEGSNSPNQGHDHCKWREDVIQMLEEFGDSYRVLAIAYNQLKSKSNFHSGSLSASIASKTIHTSCNKRATFNLEDTKLKKGCNRNEKSQEYHDLLLADTCNMKLKLEPECRDIQMEDRMTDFTSIENGPMKIRGLELNRRIEDPSMINFKSDNMWSSLKYQLTKLTEDNLHQLVELVRRNDEKRDTIRRLQLEVEALKHENKALQVSLRYSNADSECDQPRVSTA
ncbi:PREDICTED: uncharacterized protein LOC109338155 [Lupinus angustifolius]|nr:PREDICTED: uncharacterized protein LOC109338155 [Lupinus angustifolius]